MEFDARLLGSLPLPDEAGINRVKGILMALLERRVLPYFRSQKGKDPTEISRIRQNVEIVRLEDDAGEIMAVSFIKRWDRGWEILIHERIFDFLAFVIPSDPESRLGEGTRDERKMLAWAELLLRHQAQHVLYPQHSEWEVISGDIEYGLFMRSSDPTYYRTLREALSDEMNGIRGTQYLALLDHAEQSKPTEGLIRKLLDGYVEVLARSPLELLEGLLGSMDPELIASLLGHCFRHSKSTSLALAKRWGWMRKLLELMEKALEGEKAKEVFDKFAENWGITNILQELEISEDHIEDLSPRVLLEAIKRVIQKEGPAPKVVIERPTKIEITQPPKEGKTLKDRIEEARKDPLFPAHVLEVIEKNKLNAVGHSGSKYSELIETLLAIPWGKFKPIEISPEEFEEGLNRGHYGLERPKEILCDFFTNLIWRYKKLGPPSEKWSQWKRTGSAFLLVGPPGVGKTSLAISVAENLSIPYHKISLGGMKDEADLRGHGFTYEGSKPGAIVQGLMRMGVMNGMFIMDEADKTERFAVATLLEILDFEQNHLFHDKYTQTTVDIDLSNCHFMLTANTLETVPPPVANRCEIIFLDRYSVEEKIAIAQRHLIRRVREKHQITEQEIFFDPQQEKEILRFLIRVYTHEAGVRELERLLRTLFLRIQRKEIIARGRPSVCITREKVKEFLDEPRPPRRINPEDRIGEMLALGVNPEAGVGSIIPIQATAVPQWEAGGKGGPLSIVHATGNIERIMDESRKVATTGLFHCARDLGIALDKAGIPVHLHFMGASTKKDGPSAGGAIALALASLLTQKPIRRDVAMTGEIDTKGRITAVGGIDLKLEVALQAGCKTMIIPNENLKGGEGMERLPQALKEELQILEFQDWAGPHQPFDYSKHILQVVAVKDITEAAQVALIHEEELQAIREVFVGHARMISRKDFRPEGTGPFVVLVKNLQELAPRCLDASFWQHCKGCMLLALPWGGEEDSKASLASLEGKVRIYRFNPKEENLSMALSKLLRDEWTVQGPPEAVSISAPFYFIQRDGIHKGRSTFEGIPLRIRLFSNNYTLQGVKIKGCKPILNLVYSKIAGLPEDELKSCFFLKPADDIWVVDMNFIPEKYRLDVERAERILQWCLEAWLEELEGTIPQANFSHKGPFYRHP